MSSKIKGKQIDSNTITQTNLNLSNPSVNKDAVTKAFFDARTINGKPLSSNISLTNVDIPGITNVDNTSDINKPISTAQQAEINKRLTVGTSTDFQNWFNDALPSFHLTDAQRQGLYIYDSTDTTTAASARTLVKGSKRFKKQYTNYVSVTEFGAKGDYNPTTYIGTDDTAAFQAALNYATDKGLALLIDEGSYLISDTLRPKKVNNKKDFRLTLVGKGKGVSNIHGKRTDNSLVGKNLLDFDFQVGDDPAWNNSEIKISDITFWAGKADRCLYADRVIDIELDTCAFIRGQIQCVKIGTGLDGNTFAGYVHNCYFNGATDNGGQNGGCLEINCGYAEIYNNVSDGGKYSLSGGFNQYYIAGNTFEGYKKAGMYSSNTGGGANKIIGNTLRPYSGFDPNAVFDGNQNGIWLNAITGGMASNTIIGNQIFVPDPITNDVIANIATISGIIPSPHAPHYITGGTSGTVGYVAGINTVGNYVQLGIISGGPFQVGETITQATTGGTFTIASFVTNTGYALNLTGNAGFNSIIGNRLSGGTFVVNLESPGNLLSGNWISTVRDGIRVTTSATIVGNYFSQFAGSGSWDTITRIGNNPIVFENNTYNGKLNNVAPQKLSNITTTNRNALTSGEKYSGLLLNDTTLNKLTHWDGTNWNIIPIERFISEAACVTDLDTTGVSGSFTWGADTLNKPEGYGTLLNIVGATSNGDATTTSGSYLNQLLFGTQGEIYWRQRIYSYGTFTPSGGAAWKLWTSKHFSPIAAQTNSAATTSTVAAGATPTKAEFDALRADYLAVKSTLDSLLTKMRTSKILLT